MAMPGEFEFYAARSGLPATANLNEHQRAYWAAELGLSASLAAEKPHAELEWLFYRVLCLDTMPWYTLGDLRMRYFCEQMGRSVPSNVMDVMAAFFADAATPSPVLNPGFEVAAADWTGTGATVVSRTTAEHHSGVGAGSVLTDGAAGSGTYQGPGALGSWAAGQRVSGAIWVKAPIGMLMQLQVAVIGGSTVTAPANVVGDGTWQQLKVEGGTITGPITTAPYLFISSVDAVPAFTFFIDDAAVVRAPTI